MINFKFIFAGSLLFLICISLAGCFSSNPEDICAFTKPYEANVTAEYYTLQPPDEIEVISSTIPEIHQQIQKIRPDGKISFENLGEIDVAGKTPREVAEIIAQAASKLYAVEGENIVNVKVSKFASQYFFVLGEVAFPGARVFTGRETTIRVLAEAQPTVLAWKTRIQIIRPDYTECSRPMIFELDYDRMSAHGDMSQNVLLQGGDIIYVPPTVLAAVAMKVEEFIRPIARAFSTVNIIQGPPSNSR